jgi:hypothetical protein
MKEPEIVDDCPICHGARSIKEKNGTIHICFTCLAEGRLDQHGDKSKIKDAHDFGIRL